MKYKRCLACGTTYDSAGRRCYACGSPNALTMVRREPRTAPAHERVRPSYLFDSRNPQSIFDRGDESR